MGNAVRWVKKTIIEPVKKFVSDVGKVFKKIASEPWKVFEYVGRTIIGGIATVGGMLISGIVYPFDPSKANELLRGSQRFATCIMGLCGKE
jgi:hypothetical protein